MKINVAKKRADQLRSEIERHNDLYYKANAPVVSDFEYDLILHELETIEKMFPELQTDDSPTRRVGSDILEEFVQITHDYPMLSLANTYSSTELTDFDTRIRKTTKSEFTYVCELKLDGASISLKYSKGRLIRALTRGDGEKGDDVTANVKTIKSIPRTVSGDMVPDEFIIRGEIIIHKGDFRKMNEQRVSNGEQPFANPRNAASGTLKLLDSKTVASRPLDCYLYYLISEDLPYADHFSNMNRALSWGFKISDSMKLCSGINEVLEYIKYWEGRRKDIDYEIDGVVVKVNNHNVQKELGYTSKTPRWAVAYKYQAEQALTRLVSVSFQVGRSGAVTPVANLEPVLLAGTVVKRATLHNADQIILLDLHSDDLVYIEKGGEIIPKIIGVDVRSRKSSAKPVSFLSNCPECGAPLNKADGESAWVCPNDKSCPPQIKGRIEHFVGRKAMNIDGMGEETVDLLFSEGLIRSSADLYKLTINQLANLARMGDKSATNIIKSIERSKEIPWHKVLFAIGIRHVGETTARTLAKRFKGIDDLMNASVEELTVVPDVGPKIASSIHDFFSDQENNEMIESLRMSGISLSGLDDSVKEKSDILSGKSFVITGTFNLHEREAYKDIILRLGGRNSSSVSSGTSFLLAGANPGPSKMEAARKYGVKIINEEEFQKMTGN